MSLITKFRRRSWHERTLLGEALWFLIGARLLVLTVPFRRFALSLGLAQRETPIVITPEERAVAVEVSWAVQAIARHAPLDFVCLPQAIAAKWMLRRRHLASTLYLGVASGREKEEAMTAHAWLRVGSKIVTGEREAGAHAVLLTLADQPR